MQIDNALLNLILSFAIYSDCYLYLVYNWQSRTIRFIQKCENKVNVSFDSIFNHLWFEHSTIKWIKPFLGIYRSQHEILVWFCYKARIPLSNHFILFWKYVQRTAGSIELKLNLTATAAVVNSTAQIFYYTQRWIWINRYFIILSLITRQCCA